MRILTLKNFWRTLLIVIVGFGVIDLAFHFRHSSGDDFGRLLSREMKHPPVVASRAPAVIHEGEIPDAESADPYLMAPAARAQYLGTPTPNQPATTLAPALPPTTVSASATAAPAEPPASMWLDPTPNAAAKDGRVTIVGGQDGVSIRTTTASHTPKLTGGIFR